MNIPLRQHRSAPPSALHERAMDDLRFIRQTMARAGSFTAIPGWGGVAIGLLALGAALLSARQTTSGMWLSIWLATAVLASIIGAVTLVLKARRARLPLSSGPGREFLLSFLPTVSAAMALTAALYLRGGGHRPAARSVAAVLRRGNRGSREVLGPRDSINGQRVHGIGSARVGNAGRVGRSLAGCGLWWFAHWVRSIDCEAPRWLRAGQRSAIRRTQRTVNPWLR